MLLDPAVQRKFRKKMKKWHPGPLWDWLLHGILGFIFVSTLLILVVLIDTYKLTIKKINLNFVWLTFSPQALECIFVLVFSRKFRLRDLGFKNLILSNFHHILPGLKSGLRDLGFRKFTLYFIFAVSCLVSIDKRTTLTCKPHDGMILSLTLLLQIQVLLVPVHHIPQLLWGCSYMPDSLGGGDHFITPLSW